MLSEFWNFIKIRFKTKLSIFAIVFLGASFFNIIPIQSLKVIFLLLTLVFIPVMAVVATIDSIKNLYFMISFTFKKKIPIDTPSEVLELAQKIGVKCKKFTIIQDFDNAFVSPFGEVSVGEKLLSELSMNELLAVFAHEFGHHKERHILKRIGMIALIFIAGYISLYQLPGVLMTYAFFAFVSIAIIPVNWDAEFKADKVAKENGYAIYLISALEKISVNQDPSEGSDTHPPVMKRIQILQNNQK